jgi:hypothetical protein
MTRQLTSAVRHKLLPSPHAKRPPHGRLRSSRLAFTDEVGAQAMSFRVDDQEPETIWQRTYHRYPNPIYEIGSRQSWHSDSVPLFRPGGVGRRTSSRASRV